MNKKRLYKITIFILLLNILFDLCGCQEKESTNSTQNKTEEFPKEFFLKGEEILKDKLGVLAIYQVDTLLLIYLRKMNNFFHIYHANNLDSLGVLGVRGNAPTEWQAPYFSGQYKKENGDVKVWLNDKKKYQLMLVNVSQSLKSKEVVVERKIAHRPNLNFTQDVFCIENKLIGNMGLDALNKGRLQIYDLNNQNSKITPLFPKNSFATNMSIQQRYNLYFDYLVFNESKQIFASAMSVFNRIDIFDKDGKILNSYLGKKNAEKPSFSEKEFLKSKDFPDYVAYYKSLTSNSKYIYALYYEQKESEYGEKMIDTQIHIFDWKANPIMKLKLPYYLMNISIDEKNTFLYGVDFFQEKNYRFNLKNILNLENEK